MNKYIKKIAFICIIVLSFISNGFGQKDTLFWFSAPEVNRYHSAGSDIAPDNTGVPVYIHLTTFENAANVTISMPANAWFTPINIAIPANTTQRIDLSPYVDDNEPLVNEFTSLENKLRWTTSNLAVAKPFINKGTKGIKISSNQYITAYYEIGVKYNMDLISLKGNNALGKQFYVPFQTSHVTRSYNYLNRPYSSIDIVATEDNTKILVTTDKNVWARGGTPENKPAGTHVIWLDKGETSIITPYEFQAYTYLGNPTYQTSFTLRLSGSYVEVDQSEGSGAPISIITHDDLVRSDVTLNPDYVTDQLVPIDHIGTEYAVIQAPPSNGILEDEIFVVGTVDGTTGEIKTGPNASTVPFSINAGETFRFDFRTSNRIVASVTSSEPVYVYHMAGAGRQKAGALIPTISTCTGSYKVAFNRTKDFFDGATYDFYLTILARTSAIGNFKLLGNGVAVATVPEQAVLADINDPNSYDILPEAGDPYDEWRYARIDAGNLNENIGYLLANDTNFFHLGVINGYTTKDAFYGYFSNFNEIQASAVETGGQAQLAQVCEGDTIFLEAEGGKKYHWTPHDYLDDPYSPTPTAVLPPGIYNYDVRIQGECDLDTTITIQLECLANPEAFFTLSSYKGCAPFDVEIQNQSGGADKFSWDFSNDASFDSITSDPNGTILYRYDNTTSTDSVYTIRVVAREVGVICTDEYTNTLQVYPEINAAFAVDDSIGCNSLTVNFTDNSNGNLDKYQWVFDDGKTSNTAGNVINEFSHVDPDNTAEFDVELRLTSPYFCRDTARKTIKVYPYLDGEFNIDVSSGCSPLDVTITNISAGEDTIDLDFGDTSPHYEPATFTTVTHTYINNGTTVLNYPLELQAINDEGCVKIWRDTITVYPSVQAAFVVDTGRVCNTGPVQFTRTSPNGTHIASEFEWTFGDGSNSDTTALVFNKTYNNVSNSNKTYPVRLIARSQYSCADTATRDIIAYRALANYVIDENDGCSPLDVNITSTLKGNDAEINYQWVFNNGNAPSNLRQPVNPVTYNNTGAAVSNNNLILTVQSNDGLCVSNKIETITTYPEIHIDNITVSDLDVCDSTTVNFTADILHASLPNISYSWDFNDGSSSSTNPTSHVFRNISANFLDRNVRLDVETEYGCTDFSNVNVRVRPFVNALFTLDTVIGCSPVTVDAIATQYSGIPAANYTWDFGDLSAGYSGYNPSPHTYPVASPGPNDSYIIRLDVSDQSGLCTDFMEKQITVFAEAKADFEPQSGVYDNCNPFPIKFINNSLNASAYLWDFKDGTTSILESPERILKNTSDVIKPYDVELTAITADGCEDDTSITFNVYRNVKADFSINITSGCSPLDIEITNNSKGGTYRWYWNSQTAAGAADYTSSNGSELIPHTYLNTTGANITNYLTLIAENADGCSDTLTKAIVVNSSIVAQFVYNQPDACNESDVVFTNTSTGGTSYTLSWDFGDATTLETTSNTVNKTFVNNLTTDKDFLVTMTAESENGCPDQYQEYVTVYSRLSANFSIPLKASCPPFENAVIENTSIGNNSNTYEWFVDGVSETTVTGKSPFIRTYSNSNPTRKDYQIRLLASNEHGCTSEKIDTISVYERVIAQFDMDIDQGCTPLKVSFDNQSQKTTETKYLWNFGDGASSADFEPTLGHSFYNTSREIDKPYTISLQVTSENYCSHDTTESIMVYHQPLAKFFIDKTSSCPPLVSGLDKRESLGETDWEWRFGDGSAINTTDETLTHTYQSTGVGVTDPYLLELWVGTAEGCVDSTSLTVNVFPSVTADFSYTASQFCSPVEVNFINNSSSWVTNYEWKFRDGNTSNLKDPQNRYENTGITDKTYQVYLRVASQYNCWDTISKPLTVYVQPNANFYLNPVLLKYPANVVSINNTTNFGPFDYLWEFGDLNSTTSIVEEPGSFEYDYWGQKVVKLSVESQTNANCTDTYSDTILIMPPEVNAAFEVSDSIGCLNEGFDVEFRAEQSAFNETYSYEWDFGDGSNPESGQYVDHTYTEPGIYNAQLTARSQEAGIKEDYEYQTITVYANPDVNFNFSPEKEVMLDATTLEARVKFYNLTEPNDTAGCSYTWDFGDGETSVSKDVTHAYKPDPDDIPIEYYVTLYAKTLSGRCRDSLTHAKPVKIIGAGAIRFPNAFTPDGYGPSENEIFRPIYEGVIEYELYIYNRWGELIFTTKDLNDGWDGNINGDMAKPDVYVWKAKGKFTNGKAFELAGDVTLIR